MILIDVRQITELWSTKFLLITFNLLSLSVVAFRVSVWSIYFNEHFRNTVYRSGTSSFSPQFKFYRHSILNTISNKHKLKQFLWFLYNYHYPSEIISIPRISQLYIWKENIRMVCIILALLIFYNEIVKKNISQKFVTISDEIMKLLKME